METSNLHTIRSDCCVKKPGIPVTEQYLLENYLYCQEVKTEMCKVGVFFVLFAMGLEWFSATHKVLTQDLYFKF